MPGGRAPRMLSSMPDTITGKYLSVTSFKRDGTAIATPVWFVADGGHLLVETEGGSFKAKRIRRNPEVMVAPCSASGRLRGEPVRARAEFLPEIDRQRVEQLLARKYRVDRVLILPIYRAVQRLRGNGLPQDRSQPVILSITPTS
jgi:PPOX class probable F420-dependent enzyme